MTTRRIPTFDKAKPDAHRKEYWNQDFKIKDEQANCGDYEEAAGLHQVLKPVCPI